METETSQTQQNEKTEKDAALYKQIDKAIDDFMKEVKSSDPSWEKISSDDTVTFWKQKV